MQIAWKIFGILALGLGMAGVFLPLLPTVPFLLLATFCFSRSSTFLHSWLVTHPKLGPPIKRWNDNGAIHHAAKVWASISIAIAFIISLVIEVSVVILLVQIAALCCVLLFIWTRPDK